MLRWTTKGVEVNGRGADAHFHFHITESGACSRLVLSRRHDILVELADLAPPQDVTPASIVHRLQQVAVAARRELVRDEAVLGEIARA